MGGSIVDITLETLFKLCDWKIANKDLGIYVNTGVKLTDDDNAAYAYTKKDGLYTTYRDHRCNFSCGELFIIRYLISPAAIFTTNAKPEGSKHYYMRQFKRGKANIIHLYDQKYELIDELPHDAIPLINTIEETDDSETAKYIVEKFRNHEFAWKDIGIFY